MLTVQFLAGWVALAVIVALVAANFGHSFWATLIAGVLLSPLVAVLLVLVFKPEQSKRVRCPECAELVLQAANKCKHCGADLSSYRCAGRGKA